ncbi:MAG: TonB-dependent receptor, partial [Cellvibrionales bacterium]|nr:TonB-dependent receptor [Cellvibrionales bacterium]
TLKGATGGELNPKTPYRLATQTTRSDGFIKNHHLARDDTNNIDETTARARLAHAATPNLDLGLTLFHANIDNGYDIFNFDNTRQTRTNHPGHDRQKTQALALTADWQRTPTQTLELRLSGAASDLEYGYDEDWSNPQLCQLDPCPRGDFGYHSTTDNYARDNRTLTLDTRLKTTPSDHTRTTIGTYHRRQQIDLTRTTTATSPFTSRHQDTRHALYGELAQDLRPQLTLTAGARLESRHATYADSAPFQFTTRENLWGGKLALSHRPTAQTLLYAALSRGYKPGGANANPDLPPPFRHYRTETTLNTELGIKTQHPNFQAQLTAFHQRRRNIQAKSAIVDCAPAGGPCTFTEYLTNAATATHRGIEAQLTWHPNARTSLATALGLLHTAFGPGYTNFQHIAADNQTATGIDMTGRALPHAPRYQFTAALDRQLTPALRLHLDLEGKDRFLFSNDHDHRSTRYTLLNARLSYQPPQNPNWSAALWGKNLTNKTYQTRGFGTFGNDPRNGYACCGPYYQLADPRTLGLNIRHQF